MSVPTSLDHCVIHVSDWTRSNKFYVEVMGATLVTRPVGFAYRFGDRRIVALARRGDDPTLDEVLARLPDLRFIRLRLAPGDRIIYRDVTETRNAPADE